MGEKLADLQRAMEGVYREELVPKIDLYHSQAELVTKINFRGQAEPPIRNPP